LQDEDIPRIQAREPLNWARITRYAVLMFLLHFSIGVLEGALAPSASDTEAGIRQMVTGLAVALLVNVLMFARLVYRQRERRLQHVALVFLLMLGIAQTFNAVIGLWLSLEQPMALTVLEWSVSVLGVLLGTLAGYAASIRRGMER
jgi:hypothetical protein